jgi:predicted ATPase
MPPIVGRETELQALRAELTAARRGERRIARVEGEAGIGKTALVDAALSPRAVGRAQVLRGRAHELEQEIPFALLRETLELSADSEHAPRAALARLLEPFSGDAGGITNPELRFKVVHELVALIRTLAEQEPLVLAPTTCVLPGPSNQRGAIAVAWNEVLSGWRSCRRTAWGRREAARGRSC